MKEEIRHIREWIGKNAHEQAFDALIRITANDADLAQQVLTLRAKFNDVRKKDNLGLIASNESFVIRAQVNYALLEILKEVETKYTSSAVPGRQNTVFISYSHSDVRVANQLKEKLTAQGIRVAIDSEKLQPGDDIREFIEKSIRETAATISIVSRRSILSTWVAMETFTSYAKETFVKGKAFIACYIEDDFFDRKFTDETMDLIDAELKEIEAIKQGRLDKGRNTRDINNEYTRWKELSNGIDEIIRRLRECYCVDIREGNLDSNLPKILSALNPG